MIGYYAKKLHGKMLLHCYEIAPPRIQQYLNAEIDYLIKKIPHGSRILELGCGYGRVLKALGKASGSLFGIDISLANIEFARKFLKDKPDISLSVMNGLQLAFPDNAFDSVFCIQNGISAFHVDKKSLIAESIRVTRDEGMIFFSSYSAKIWPERLQWFGAQASAGLVGRIDPQKTYPGVIVCEDGFTATTVSHEELRDLVVGFPVDSEIEEVDRSSLFCALTVDKSKNR